MPRSFFSPGPPSAAAPDSARGAASPPDGTATAATGSTHDLEAAAQEPGHGKVEGSGCLVGLLTKQGQHFPWSWKRRCARTDAPHPVPPPALPFPHRPRRGPQPTPALGCLP